jgi:hypothetical protein
MLTMVETKAILAHSYERETIIVPKDRTNKATATISRTTWKAKMTVPPCALMCAFKCPFQPNGASSSTVELEICSYPKYLDRRFFANEVVRIACTKAYMTEAPAM